MIETSPVMILYENQYKTRLDPGLYYIPSRILTPFEERSIRIFLQGVGESLDHLLSEEGHISSLPFADDESQCKSARPL